MLISYVANRQYFLNDTHVNAEEKPLFLRPWHKTKKTEVLLFTRNRKIKGVVRKILPKVDSYIRQTLTRIVTNKNKLINFLNK